MISFKIAFMKNVISAKSKIATSKSADNTSASVLVPTQHAAETSIGTIPASMTMLGAEKIFTRYSFDDNGGGYQGL